MSTQLSDYFNKCRCCLEDLNGKAAYNITDFFEAKFYEVTQLNLISSEQLSTRICLQCSSEVTRITTIRNTLIQNQSFLMELCAINIKTEVEPEPQDILETFIVEGLTEIKQETDYFVKDEEPTLDYSNDNDVDSEDDFKLSDIRKPDLIKFVKAPEGLRSGRDVKLVNLEVVKPKPKRIRVRVKKPKEKKEKKVPGFFCDICDRYNKTRNLLKEHMERFHEKKKNYHCDGEGCTYASYGPYEMQLHKFNRHGAEHPTRKDGYFCETCGSRFKTTSKLKEHIDKKHLFIKNFACDHCHMRFYKKECLRRHILKHIPKEHRNFSVPCDECGKMMFNIFTLKTHKDLVHRRIKKYSCEICGKLYESRSRLKIHIDSFHKGLREVECSICNGKYTTKLALRGHIKRQHPESLGLKKQTYTCDVCNAKCPSRQGLQLHMRRHGEPLYPCDVCGKKYFDRSKMLDHQSVHRVLEFKCEYCPRSYRREARLKAHYKVVHFKPKRTYRCEVCNSTFTRRTTLRDHVQRQHSSLESEYRDDLIARILQMLPEEQQGK